MDKNKLLLLVEDEAIIALTQKKLLERYGYRVITASSGDKAIEIARQNDDIDLILMDIDLGAGIDGPETAIIILKYRDIPVIFLSSHTEPEIVEKTERITSYGYVVKSSTITVLDASIKMAFKLFDANRKIVMNEVIQKTMISNISDITGIIDANGIMKYISPNITKWFGWLPEELTGADGLLTVHPEDADHTRKEFVSVLENDMSSRTLEYRYRCKNGDYKYIELTASNLVNDPLINGILMNYRDITNRKKTEIELKQKEEQLRTVSDNIPEGFVYQVDSGINGEQRRITYLSAGIEKLFGVRAEDVINDSTLLYGKFMENDRPMIADCESAAIKNMSMFSIETRYLGSSGEIRHLLINSTPSLRPDNHLVWNGIVIDVTGLKQTEALLKESEERYRELFNNTKSGVAIYTAKDNGNDFIFKDINKTGEKLDNDKRQNLVGRSVLDVRTGIKEFGLFDVFRRVWKTGKPEHFPVNLYNDNRLTGWYENYVYRLPSGEIVAIYDNLTEQKRIEDALRESEELFTAFMTNLPACAFIKDEKGRNIFVNEYLRDMMGFHNWVSKTNEELPDKETAERISGDDCDAVKHGPIKIEETMIDRHGVSHIFETIKFPIYIENKPSMLGGIAMDITGYKNAEEKISDLLKEKELILKEVHHRIKNFMNTIKGLLFLQIESFKDPSVITALQDIESRVFSMMILYDKLYRSENFSNMSLCEYLPVLVDEITATFPIKTSVKIEKTIDDFKLDIKILQPIGIIINELLTNAMKHAFNGRESGLIAITAKHRVNHCTIEVMDNGCGLDESISFENSPGFGMQLVMMLSRQIGAAIRIERGEGTKFIIEFDE